ncbi:hypothetical protein [Endozoicomonas atrinae]|uniref:hypothetical protein n=1 Tax=Endozoicomonas atrinae TaxID=1333660 RepID=UPI003B00E8C3
MKRLLLTLPLIILTAGCSSLTESGSSPGQQVALRITPEGITVYEQTVSGQKKLGVTPANVMLTPAAGKIFIFKKEGYYPQMATLKANGNPERGEYQFLNNEVHVTMQPAR